MITAIEQFLQPPRQALGRLPDHKIHSQLSVSASHMAFAPSAATVLRMLDRTDETDIAGSSSAHPTHVRRASLSPVRLPQELLPRHIAIIMDGNARWAQTRRLHTNLGHEAGTEALQRTVQCCLKWNVPALTVFAFSEENWKRADAEVSFLLGLTERLLLREVENFRREGVRLHVIGSQKKLPVSLQRILTRVEADTAGGSRLHLTIALSYGGRQDIVQAAKRIAQDVLDGEITISQIDEASVADRLGLSQLPPELRDPDLLIRTSGEERVSNFLLWELAYCELHFSQSRWPDFGEADFRAALGDYCARQRRFGRR